VDATSDGILENAETDFNKIVDWMVGNGLYDRPVKVVLTSYAYSLLKKKRVLYLNINNLQYMLNLLPEGSEILVSNNIQATVTAGANSMCALVQTQQNNDDGNDEEGGYQLLATGIDQKIHQTDLWQHRYGLREKFSVKVMSNQYVGWMDNIDTVT
jgi:hypothetical protein